MSDVIVLKECEGMYVEDKEPLYRPKHSKDLQAWRHFMSGMEGRDRIYKHELPAVQEVAHLHRKFIVIEEEDNAEETADNDS